MTTLLNLDPSQVPDDGNSLVYNAASKKWLPGKAGGIEPRYLDSFAWLGSDADFVTGQTVAPTTTTAVVAAGSSVLPVASVTGLVPGVALVINRGTSNQQILTVASVAGSNVTTSVPTVAALDPGATVSPMWTNSSHLTSHGYDAMAYWIANHPDLPDLTGKKVTFLGNSWFAGKSEWAARITERFPTATVVEAGVPGDTSTALLARFEAAVPIDSDYVIINEPGVNDTLTLDQATSSANLGKLKAMVRAIGAEPIFTGPSPISTHPTKSAALADRVAAFAVGNYQGAVTPAVGSSYFVGPGSGSTLTTGASNVGIGVQALERVTTGSSLVGVGQLAGQLLTTAQQCVMVGAWAGRLATTGWRNTLLGHMSGYNGAAITTGQRNTAVGYGTGLPVGSAQCDDVTVVGHAASSASTNGTALGSDATVATGHTSSVALGSDTVTTAANQVMVGPRDVEVTDTARGIILKSPDGTRYRVTVANGGTLTVTAA